MGQYIAEGSGPRAASFGGMGMKYNFSILATALAVGLFALPAWSAVSDVEGGTATDNTIFERHYTTHDRGTRVDKTTHNSRTDNTYEVQGKLRYKEGNWTYGQICTWHHYYDEKVKNFNRVGDNPSNARSDIDGVTQDILNAANSFIDGRNNITKELNSKYGRNGGMMHHINTTNDYISDPSLDDDYDAAGANRGDATVALYWTKKGEGDTTTTHSTETRQEDYRGPSTFSNWELYNIESKRGIDAEPNSIMVGDPDSIANAYAAQGDVSADTVVDLYYQRDEYYKYGTNTVITDVTQKHTVYQVEAKYLISPIVLDLDGDGAIQASDGQYLAHDTFSNRVAMFDFFGNGFPVLMEWVGPNDGLLCRPAADGSVKGTDLFGTANGMANGYEEMASLDKDNDGKLQGEELEGLCVWTDLNGNAIAEKGEVKSLQELGITSLSWHHIDYRATFERNGKTYRSFDWWPNCREMRKVNLAGLFE